MEPLRLTPRINDWYAFCDICGKRCFASEMTRLTQYTGKEGMLVCSNDVDKIDFGLVPYKTSQTRPVPFTRPGTPVYDFVDEGQDLTLLSTSQGDYLATSQGDIIAL